MNQFDKNKAWEKFKSEHPKWVNRNSAYYRRQEELKQKILLRLERLNDMTQMRKLGYSLQQIGRKYHMTRQAVYSFLK